MISYTVEVSTSAPSTITAGLLLEETPSTLDLRAAQTDHPPVVETTSFTTDAPDHPADSDGLSHDADASPPPADRSDHPFSGPPVDGGSTPSPPTTPPTGDTLEPGAESPTGQPADHPTTETSHSDPEVSTDSSVFAIASAKGGVGKTTTAINLGAALAHVSAASVIVVEFDLAMANFVDFLKFDYTSERDTTLHDVLAGSAPVADAIYLAPGGFDVLPSGTTLDGYRNADPQRFGAVLNVLRTRYDYVLIDCGAGVSYETILPLGLATAVILVSQPRVASIRDTKKTSHLVDRVGGTIGGIVFTNSGTGRAPPVDRIVDYLGVELLGHIPSDDCIPASQDIGLPTIKYDETGEVSKAYYAIAESIIGHPEMAANDPSNTSGTDRPFSPDT